MPNPILRKIGFLVSILLVAPSLGCSSGSGGGSGATTPYVIVITVNKLQIKEGSITNGICEITATLHSSTVTGDLGATITAPVPILIELDYGGVAKFWDEGVHPDNVKDYTPGFSLCTPDICIAKDNFTDVLHISADADLVTEIPAEDLILTIKSIKNGTTLEPLTDVSEYGGPGAQTKTILIYDESDSTITKEHNREQGRDGEDNERNSSFGFLGLEAFLFLGILAGIRLKFRL